MGFDADCLWLVFCRRSEVVSDEIKYEDIVALYKRLRERPKRRFIPIEEWQSMPRDSPLFDFDPVQHDIDPDATPQ